MCLLGCMSHPSSIGRKFMVLYKYDLGAPLHLIDSFESRETELKTDNIYVVGSYRTYGIFERPDKEVI